MKPQRRFWAGLEWRWSLVNLVFGIPGAIASFATTAWFSRGTAMFAELGSFAWIAAGFAGLLAFSIGLLLLAIARRLWVITGYDARLAEKSGIVDPMRSTFERKRIYMSDFVLPSTSLVEGKTFIQCEIIGPMNFLLDFGNRIDEPRYPASDAIVLKDNAIGFNTVLIRSCTFRGCTFSRITFFFRPLEYERIKHLQWLNWIAGVPIDDQPMLPLPAPAIGAPADHQAPPPADNGGDSA